MNTTEISPKFEDAITAAVDAAREANIHHHWVATYCERRPRNFGCRQERHPIMAALAISSDLATLDSMAQGVKDDAWRLKQEMPEGAWIIAYRPGLLANKKRGYNSRMGAARVANWSNAKVYSHEEYIAALDKQTSETLAKINAAIAAYCEAGRILADECGVLPKGSLWRPWERGNVVTPQLVARRASIDIAICKWAGTYGDEPVFISKGDGFILSDAAKALPPECAAGSFVFTPGWWASPLYVTVRTVAKILLSDGPLS